MHLNGIVIRCNSSELNGAYLFIYRYTVTRKANKYGLRLEVPIERATATQTACYAVMQPKSIFMLRPHHYQSTYFSFPEAKKNLVMR